MKFKRINLFKHLSPIGFKALESASVLCRTRNNLEVDLSHYLNQLLLAQNSDLTLIVNYFGLDPARLSQDLISAMDRLKRGFADHLKLSPLIENAVKDAFFIASIADGCYVIRSGYVILALLQNPASRASLFLISPEFKKIDASTLEDKFQEILKDGQESSSLGFDKEQIKSQTSDGMSPGLMGKEEALSLYTQDLTDRARSGGLDPVVGRDGEIRNLINILLRRRQNNPLLTGEAGVGKTAVVEGFAQRLASGDVPDALKGSRLLSLDLGLLQAGASMKGEFEQRLKQVIDEIQNADVPTILFIDEAHTLIGAGGSAGQNDAANLLKPMLARGQLRCIAATTYQEYVKYFEKDPALSRRFQNISVNEPDDNCAYRMLSGIKKSLETHHHVIILDEALHAAVTLSRRYLPLRQLPDKAVSVLDTACAKVNLSASSCPAIADEIRRELSLLNKELSALQSESEIGIDHAERILAIETKSGELRKELEGIDKRLSLERELNAELEKIESKIASLPHKDDLNQEREILKADLQESKRRLAEVQAERPLILSKVDKGVVAGVISEWTGIPVGRMVSEEIKNVLTLKRILSESVKGQDHALELIAKRIMTARAGLADPKRPIAVLMLAGPSGTGKTQSALTLAQCLYGSEQNLITVNMSEFQEPHTVSTLKGAPPGYVGYGEGGVLTEAVRRKPYSVVLLDEIEKAHKDVHEIFFQVFDKGRMEDGAGRLIDFRNTVILMTTNIGDEVIANLCRDESHLPDSELLAESITPQLRKVFPAALLGRLSVIPFYPLGKSVLNEIIDLKLKQVINRIADNYKAGVHIEDNLYEEIISRCNNAASGARLIDAVINNDLLPEISAMFLQAALDGKTINCVNLSASNGSFAVRILD